MPELEFRDPLFLLVGLAAPLLWWLAARLPSAVVYSSLALADRAPRSLRMRLAGLPALGLALAWLVLSVALAGPRTGQATTSVSREGIAIMLVVDRSLSMNARDFVEGDLSISRMDAVKGVLREFIAGGDAGQGRPDDLLGIVAFATYADGVCPLTLDHGNLLAILDQVEVAMDRTENSTAIGEGLGLAIERLRGSEAESKVVILLTDGVNNAGNLDPLAAAELAATAGIKVYTVAAGRNGYAPFPVPQRGGGTRLQRVRVEVDEETVRQIAERTGGRYFHASNEEGLKEVYAEIDRLERSEITELRYVQYEEHYAMFAGAGLLLLLASGLAAGTWLRRLP
jgi:Ca-activated chloride channel family protein